MTSFAITLDSYSLQTPCVASCDPTLWHKQTQWIDVFETRQLQHLNVLSEAQSASLQLVVDLDWPKALCHRVAYSASEAIIGDSSQFVGELEEAL